MDLQALGLTDLQANFWDILVKGGTAVVALIGGFVAVTKFLHERREANRTALLEAQKPFLTTRQEVYSELVGCTAAIATRGDQDPKRIAAEERFWELYWGPIPLVADDQVGAAVDVFHLVLARDRYNEELLRNSSMDLAEVCRASLGFAPKQSRRRHRRSLARTGGFGTFSAKPHFLVDVAKSRKVEDTLISPSDPNEPTTIPTVKARQGRRGWQVLMVLICALVLAMVVWAGVEFYGEAIDTPEPVTEQR